MIGVCLLGDGKGNFEFVNVTNSSFFVNSDAKDIKEIALKNGRKIVIVSSNFELLHVFTVLSK